MRVFSQDFNDGEKMPEKHVFNGMGYQGENISPTLPGKRRRKAPKVLW